MFVCSKFWCNRQCCSCASSSILSRDQWPALALLVDRRAFGGSATGCPGSWENSGRKRRSWCNVPCLWLADVDICRFNVTMFFFLENMVVGIIWPTTSFQEPANKPCETWFLSSIWKVMWDEQQHWFAGCFYHLRQPKSLKVDIFAMRLVCVFVMYNCIYKYLHDASPLH